MAATFWTPVADAFQTNIGMPGAQPNGSQMQGNPNVNGNNDSCIGAEPNQPQNTSSQLAATQLANGTIPHNEQPTNVSQGTGPAQQGANAGGDSLLAMLSRGQVILNQSTYGQGSYVPANGGAGPVPVPAATVVAQVTGQANNITQPANVNVSGA
jgi:hypothetical protein